MKNEFVAVTSFKTLSKQGIAPAKFGSIVEYSFSNGKVRQFFGFYQANLRGREVFFLACINNKGLPCAISCCRMKPNGEEYTEGLPADTVKAILSGKLKGIINERYIVE